MDIAGLLESSRGDLRSEDHRLPSPVKSDPLLFRLPIPLQRGFQSCKPVLDAGHDADMEEVLGVVGGGVAAKAELPPRFPLQCRRLRRALPPSTNTTLAWSARGLEVGVDMAGEGNLEFNVIILLQLPVAMLLPEFQSAVDIQRRCKGRAWIQRGW